MVYENILQLCKERGISISRLEQACGLGNGVVGGWRTASPRTDRLKLVADFFEVSLDYLLEDHTKPVQ